MAASPTALVLAALLSAPGASGDVAVSTADGLRRALRAAAPGTRILVAPGDYRGYFSATGLHGTDERPIVVAAADPARPPVLHGAGECLHLSDVSHLVLRRLVLVRARVNCLNIDDGGTFDTPSHHVVLDGLTVRDITLDGNRDAIKLSGLDDFLVRDCTVERWGSGGSGIDMMGCHRGLVVGCTFRHRNGQGATGVQAKGGSRDVVVHGCRFADAGQRAVNLGGYADALMRPPDATCQATRVAAVGNVIVGSKAAVAFVGSDGCIASYNTIYRPTAWVLRILQEVRQPPFVPCRNGELRGNLVVWRWRELKTAADVRGGTEPKTFRFASNWWFCEDRPSRSRPDLPAPDYDGIVGRDPGLVVEGLSVAARDAPDHGAHAPRAAELFAELGPKLAPWAFATARKLSESGRDRPLAPSDPRGQ